MCHKSSRRTRLSEWKGDLLTCAVTVCLENKAGENPAQSKDPRLLAEY